MTDFPTRVELQILTKTTHKPAPNIASSVKLFTNHKNDYCFLLPLSDVSGKIVILRSWLESQIKQEQTLSIMDYSAMIDNCMPQIEITVLDEDMLIKAIQAMYTYQDFSGLTDEYINKYSDASNRLYKSTRKIFHYKFLSKPIFIELEPL